MNKYSIVGWSIFHESKPDAPPIVSVRIMVPLSVFHQSDGMPTVYINLIRNIIHRESRAYSIAGTPFVSWGLNHITIGIHTLEEDLKDFLILIQQSLRLIPSKKMLDEELQQQKNIDQWNATQPRELMYGTLYEQYFGPQHSLRSDIDGTWKQRASIHHNRLAQVVDNSWPTSMVIVSRLRWDELASIIESSLKPTREIISCSYQVPKSNWTNYAIPCSQSDQVGLMLTCPARIINDQLEYATELGLMCLAGMFHSRMNQKLRLNDGSTYGVECNYIRNKHWARIELSCFVHESQALQSWDSIQEVWNDAANNWTEEELDKTRTILIRNERLREETCAYTCAIRANHLHIRNRTFSIEESCQKWKDISLNDVQTVMSELAQAPQMSLCVGTESSIKPLGFPIAPCPQKFVFS